MRLLDRFLGKYRCTLCGKRTKVAGCCVSCVTTWLEEEAKKPPVDESYNDLESVLKLLNDAVDKFDNKGA